MEQLLSEIINTGEKYNIDKIFLFGSRARGDNTEKSDYDIAFVSNKITPELKSKISDDIDEINTFHKIDLVFLNDLNGSDELSLNIKKDGILLMSKFKIKLNNYKKAVRKLTEGIADYENSKIDTVRDGVIQRFEFTTELAWKTVREYLIDEGVININTPKSVMKEAYLAGIIEDEQGWIQILNDRNSTSHMYDENESVEISERIKLKHIKLFNNLLEKIQ